MQTPLTHSLRSPMSLDRPVTPDPYELPADVTSLETGAGAEGAILSGTCAH